MKKHLLLAIFVSLSALYHLSAQTTTLTFVGKSSITDEYIRLHRVGVFNNSQHWEEILYYPDTTLQLQASTGIEEVMTSGSVLLLQNVPNPFDGVTDFALQLEHFTQVEIEIYDINGRKVTGYNGSLDAGQHQFRATLTSPQTYLLSAQTSDQKLSIKMINEGHGADNSIIYLGSSAIGGDVSFGLRGTQLHSPLPFVRGDQMTYVGYTQVENDEYVSATVQQQQWDDELIALMFNISSPIVATRDVTVSTDSDAVVSSEVLADGNLPVTARGVCYSTSPYPTIADSHTTNGSGVGTYNANLHNLQPHTTYHVRAYATNALGTAYGRDLSFNTKCKSVTDVDGITYQAVQIGEQCWMRENLRTNVPGNNGYFDNNDAYWQYGRYYTWDVMMNGASSSNVNPSGVQGICPDGWHVPSDAEWTQLENYVSSQSEYCCDGNSGNIAKALASTTGWSTSSSLCAVGNYPSDNNATCFSALPVGYYGVDYHFPSEYAFFWSTTETSSASAFSRDLNFDYAEVHHGNTLKSNGLSVRCVFDGFLPRVATANVTDIMPTTATSGGEVLSDGGESVTARGVCWSTSPNPTIADSHTTDGNGLGSFSSNITGLTPNTTYYVRAYATNSECTAYGEEKQFRTWQSCGTVADVDGNEYYAVQIGEQCWMRENLRTDVPGNAGYPNGDANNWEYGRLYSWDVMMNGAASSSTNPSNVQGICPDGWHVPSDAEWTQLTDYVSSQSEYCCGANSGNIAKALASATGWWSHSAACAVGNDPSSNNATGFSALPVGGYSGSSYYDSGHYALFWSATESTESSAYRRFLCYNLAGVTRNSTNKSAGYSVRCIRGQGCNLPTVTTTAVSDITENTASCGGNVTSDGGCNVTARGVCWSTSPNPTIADSHTTDGSGVGGFSSNITGLTPNTTYYVRAYATNNVGTAYGEEKQFRTMWQSCGTVTDVDGNSYNTVQIGEQCWMRENLRTDVPGNAGYPNGDANNWEYGRLYSWDVMMNGASSSAANPSNVQGICPDGWHVPSDAEWTQLTDYVSSQSEYCCGGYSGIIAKALASVTGWYSSADACAVGNGPSSNNATGFSALPAGNCNSSYYYVFGNYAFFWSATEYGSDWAYGRDLRCHSAVVDRNNYFGRTDGFSVRCVRGQGYNLPTVTTTAVSDITENTASCGGNVTSDGGCNVTARGVCWSTSHNPTIAGSHTTDGSGTGSFSSNITGLTHNAYYVRAYATNGAGTGYGEEMLFSTWPNCGTVTDVDGNSYNTVQIGEQCWMRENLRTDVPGNAGYPRGDANNREYGRLYSWDVMMNGASSSAANPSNVQGICPDGWHVPSDAEWTQLTDYVSSRSKYCCDGNSDNIAKALASVTGWNGSDEACAVGKDPGSNNATGFSALPAGYYYSSYYNFGTTAFFWSATENGSDSAYRRRLYYSIAGVYRSNTTKGYGSSVRCVRD